MRDANEADELIARAQLWATGATVHNVNGLIGSIRAGLDAMSRGVDCRGDLGREMRTLREFMAHGDYRRARRENPPPGGWTRTRY